MIKRDNNESGSNLGFFKEICDVEIFCDTMCASSHKKFLLFVTFRGYKNCDTYGAPHNSGCRLITGVETSLSNNKIMVMCELRYHNQTVTFINKTLKQ